jgi:hypothetical protein
MAKRSTTVGLDVHKESIDVVVAEPDAEPDAEDDLRHFDGLVARRSAPTAGYYMPRGYATPHFAGTCIGGAQFAPIPPATMCGIPVT